MRSAIRNIMRLIDILPFLYGVGMSAIFATRHRPRVGGAPKRIGDEPFLELLVAAKAARSG